MNNLKKMSIAFCLGITCLLMYSCGNDKAEIVREYYPEGKWAYDGFSYLVLTNFAPADKVIEKDVATRNYMTDKFILELAKDGKYTMSESSILKDRGKYEFVTGGQIYFTSEMLDHPFLDSTSINLFTNDLTLSYDITSIYDKKCLDSLGITNAGQVVVNKAEYHYLFKRN